MLLSQRTTAQLLSVPVSPLAESKTLRAQVPEAVVVMEADSAVAAMRGADEEEHPEAVVTRHKEEADPNDHSPNPFNASQPVAS